MTYRRARSLDQLTAQVDAAAPRRSRVSDGWIGDAAHASRSSDHNPWIRDSRGVGVVRAQDLTHDPAGGLDAGRLATVLALELGHHPALMHGAYLIYNRRIISTARLSEGWRPYTGANPHTRHVHVSVAYAAAGYDSAQPFDLTGLTDHPPYLEEDTMRPEDFERIRTIVREEVGDALDLPLNRGPRGHTAYRGVSLRDLLKRMGRATGAVKPGRRTP